MLRVFIYYLIDYFQYILKKNYSMQYTYIINIIITICSYGRCILEFIFNPSGGIDLHSNLGSSISAYLYINGAV